MARSKSNEMSIKSLEEADKILQEMCEIEARIESIDNEAMKKIAAIKESAASEGKPFRDRYKSCVKAMEAYARYFRGELFKYKKSLERSFGNFGFRKAPDAIRVSKNTAELLKSLGFSKYVRTKLEPNKEAMLGLSNEVLEKVEAARIEKEDFFVETKRDLVNQELAKLSA